MSKYSISSIYWDGNVGFSRDIITTKGKITERHIDQAVEQLKKSYKTNNVVVISVIKIHGDSFIERIKAKIKKYKTKRQFKKAMKAEFNIENDKKDGEEIERLS